MHLSRMGAEAIESGIGGLHVLGVVEEIQVELLVGKGARVGVIQPCKCIHGGR